MSQVTLAKLIGASPTSISYWESGLRIPKIEQLMKIAEVFKINGIELLDDDRADAFSPIFGNAELSLVDAFRNLNGEGKHILSTIAQSLLLNPLYKNR